MNIPATNGKRKRRKIPVIVHRGITIRKLSDKLFMVDYRKHGEDTRKCYPTLDEAKTHADQLATDHANYGQSAFVLTHAQKLDAHEAIKILGGGVTLAEVAKDYRRRNPQTGGETVAGTIARLSESMKANGCRDISVKEAIRRLNLFANDFGPEKLTSTIDKTEISEWVERRKWKGTTARNYRNAVRTLCNFYAGTMRARVKHDEKPPTIWPPATVDLIMTTAATHHPEIAPVFAVLFFAGLRPHEALRLTWRNIDLAAGIIRIEGEQTKTREARHIDICPNLNEWLLAYHEKSGTLSKGSSWYRDTREKVMKLAGVDAWPKDVTRHSFASYLFASKEDAGYVAAQLGHWQGLYMLSRHYRAVATRADAKRYFGIKPKAGKLVKLQRSKTA